MYKTAISPAPSAEADAPSLVPFKLSSDHSTIVINVCTEDVELFTAAADFEHVFAGQRRMLAVSVRSDVLERISADLMFSPVTRRLTASDVTHTMIALSQVVGFEHTTASSTELLTVLLANGRDLALPFSPELAATIEGVIR